MLWTLLKLRAQSAFSQRAIGALLFWMLCVVFLTGLLSLALMLRTEEGIVKGFSLFQTTDVTTTAIKDAFLSQTVSSNPVDGSSPVSPEDPQHSSPAQDTAFEQARALSQVLAPPDRSLVEWLRALENNRVTQRDIVLYIQSISQLSERQKQLFARQGVVIRSWDGAPVSAAQTKGLQAGPQFWIKKDHVKKWSISGILPDMMASQKVSTYSLTDLDVVRIVLWSDELLEKEEWEKANPPPTPPASVMPSAMSVVILPSDVGLKIIFWTSAGFVALFVAIGSMLFSLSSWDALRREGVFEPLMALPFKSYLLPASYLLFWWGFVCVSVVVAAILSAIVLASLGLPVMVVELLKIMGLALSLSLLVMSIAVMLSSWRHERWWRMWVSVISTVVALALQGVYVAYFSQTRSLAALLDGGWAVLLFAVFVFVSVGLWRLTGFLMERQWRQGFRRV